MLKVKWISRKNVQYDTKIVDYLGFGIEVPIWTKYVCFDFGEENNSLSLLAFQEEPELNENIWAAVGDSEYDYLQYNIEFEGDYRESLVKVSE